jgi:hypothetical protein
MTKFTIVTDRRGKLIGAVQGHELSEKVGEVEAHVSFAAGHKLHRVDVDIDMPKIADPKEFEKTLTRLIPKPGRKTKATASRRRP